MTAQHLPNEILLQIFEQIPQRTVYQCIFICKAWHLAAVQEYYQNVQITGSMVSHLQSILRSSKDILTKKLIHGNRVKSLKFHHENRANEIMTQEQVTSLLSHLPYLKKIDLESCKKVYYYLIYIDKMFRKINFGGFKRKRDDGDGDNNKAGFLDHLEEILVSLDTTEGMKQYFRACHSARKSLTHLQFKFIQLKLTTHDGQSGTYLDFLPSFKNLTHLCIENSVAFDHGVHNLSIESVFKVCPNLTNFELKSSFPILLDNNASAAVDTNLSSENRPNANNNTTFTDGISTNTATAIPTETHRIQNQHMSTVCIYDHCQMLQVLSLQVPNISINQLLLCVPNQLEQFTLSINQDVFDVWLQECDSNAVVFLGNRLNKINSVNISLSDRLLSGNRRIESSAIVKNMPLKDRLDNYRTFINLISKERKLICHLTLDVYEDRDLATHDFSASIQSGKIDIKYGVRINSGDGIMVISSLLGFPGFNDDKKELPVIYSVDVNIKSLTQRANGAMDLMLENIVTNCRHLSNIHITGSPNTSYKLSSNLFESLNNSSNKGVISKFENFLVSIPNNNSHLNQCVLRGISPPPHILHRLTDSLKNIRFMDLKDFKRSNIAPFNIDLNFTAISHLEHFQMDVNNLSIKYRRHVFLHLVFSTNNNNDQRKDLYYRCGERQRGELLDLSPTTWKFINSYNRINSRYSILVTIRFAKIDALSLYNSSNISAPRVTLQLRKARSEE